MMQWWSNKCLMKLTLENVAMNMGKDPSRPECEYIRCNKLQEFLCETNLTVNMMLTLLPEQHIKRFVRDLNWSTSKLTSGFIDNVQKELRSVHLLQAG